MRRAGGAGTLAPMRALRFLGPGKVQLVSVPDPDPGPGEVVLRVHATGLCNSDVRVFLGEKRAAPGVIPGHEFTGEVVAAGPGAEVEPGAVVAVCPILACGRCSFCRRGFRNRCPERRTLGYDLDGGLAEFVRLPAPLVALGHLLPVDPRVPPERRAFVEPLACVLHSARRLAFGAGVAVAIVGGGPMGLVHLLVAQRTGCGPTLVVEPLPERREVAAALGADAVATPDEAVEVAKELTRGLGFPAVAVAVGSEGGAELGLRLAARMGRVNLFAGFAPGTALTLDLNRVHYDEVALFGTQNAPIGRYEEAAEIVGRMPELEQVITHRFRLEEAETAYAARLERRGLKSAVLMLD